MRIRQAVLAAALVTACGKPQPAMRTLAPDSYLARGDTVVFGSHAVLAMDSRVRYVDLDLRRPSRVFLYAISDNGRIMPLAQCWAEAGTHRVQPTVNTGWIEGRSGLLVVLISEEPREPKRVCNNSGGERLVNPMPPNEALERLAFSLRRYPDSPWASYLVDF